MKAVIFGAGNIGRGFIGQLLSQSGYEVIFLDINNEVINRINADRCYPVCIVSEEGEKEIIVNNVRAVNSLQADKVLEEIFTADIMATSVGANVLKHIAKTVANAVELRILNSKPPLNILLCENLNFADKIFKAELFNHLSENSKLLFDKNVGLVEASIGRMVPVLEKKEGENPLKVYVEEFDILHLDKNGFKGVIPQIKNVITFSPFKYFMQRKLFIHNMCHAMSAYLGAVKGYEYISQAISDSQIKYLVLMAGTCAAKAISKDNNAELDLLIDFLHKLIYRFNNAELKDTILRVGKDPIRKLKPDDRLVGAYNLCKKYNIGTAYILCGIAGALCFKQEQDTVSMQLQDSVANEGVLKALSLVCGEGTLNEDDSKMLLVLHDYIKGGNIKKGIDYCEKVYAKGIANY